jgi:hypothetical protein
MSAVVRTALRVLVVVLATLFLFQPARATDIHQLGRFGGWDAFEGLSVDGKRVCGVSELGNDGRSLMLKFFEGNDFLVVQVFKPGWSIPKGSSVPAQIQFDNFPAWSIPATGTGNMVESYVGAKDLAQFSLEFRAANQFHLTFLEGNEGAWVGQLSGSGAAMNALSSCLTRMPGGAGTGVAQPSRTSPSQPFNPPAPVTSQPFQAPPPPSQTQPLPTSRERSA